MRTARRAIPWAAAVLLGVCRLAAEAEDPAAWRPLAQRFEIVGTQGGYLRADAFLRFVDNAMSGRGGEDWLQSMFARRGWWIAASLALIGLFGLGLNLTPCVLPMIPVNVAIIGAGTAAGSKRRGVVLGAVYGAAIALSYGALGLVVVTTGARFGSLNASWLFNAVVAVVFAVLSLAMFDVVTIDFSRFQAGKPRKPGRKTFALAFLMGAVSALLAGACVAPVVIMVLVLSTDLYARGSGLALLLPFLLGAGMGLPWPFLGAGLSFLPKPGKWMERVKWGFGVLILGFALYYGRLAYTLRTGATEASASRAAVPETAAAVPDGGWIPSLVEGLRRADREGQPVFIDFWATWCRSCLHMDRTTFRDPAVLSRLEAFVRIKYQAEDLNDPGVKAVLEHFEVIGLPTYAILLPIGGGSQD